MRSAEFDQVADDYDRQHRANIALTGEEPSYFAGYKVAALARYLARVGHGPRRILDFGAGIGNSAPHFRQFFPGAGLVCADVSQRCLEIAASRLGSGLSGLHIAEDRVPCPDGAFDTVFSACVFHHIPHREHDAWIRELYRVSAPGAVLAVFEHNPLNPLTVHAVNTCPFDANARLIRAGRLAATCRDAGWTAVGIRYHVFFPKFLAALRVLDPYLSPVPFGGQYSVMARKAP